MRQGFAISDQSMIGMELGIMLLRSSMQSTKAALETSIHQAMVTTSTWILNTKPSLKPTLEIERVDDTYLSTLLDRIF